MVNISDIGAEMGFEVGKHLATTNLTKEYDHESFKDKLSILKQSDAKNQSAGNKHLHGCPIEGGEKPVANSGAKELHKDKSDNKETTMKKEFQSNEPKHSKYITGYGVKR